MAWIKTIAPEESNDALRQALDAQRALYPPEYAEPVLPADIEEGGIVATHTLIPEALHHAFATFGALLSPDLPLSRRQHEMITPEHHARLRAVGFDDRGILQITLIAAWFNYINRVADALGVGRS